MGCDQNNWDSTCTVLSESKYDPTIISPAGQRLSLIGFSTQGVGLPIYNPVWYRFRYTNTVTGGYSDFSDWTASPIMSGSCCLPCVGGMGMCSSPILSGFNSCKANAPTVGILMSDLAYAPFMPIDASGTSIIPTVHRYIGKPGETKPPDDVQDENVGFLFQEVNLNDKKYAGFIDTLDPPCGSTDGSAGDTNRCSKNAGLCAQGSITCTGSSCLPYQS